MIHEEETILKGYDPQLVRRLFAYVKPYWAYFAIAVLGLLIATTGEMLLPVLMKQAVDKDILPLHTRIRAQEMPKEISSKVKKAIEGTGTVQIEGMWFVPTEGLGAISFAEKQEYVQKEYFSAKPYLLFPINGKSREVIEKNNAFFSYNSDWAAIRQSDLKQIGKQEIKIIRNINYANLFRLVALFFFILVGVLVATFGQIYLMAFVGQQVMKDLRTELFNHTINRSLRFLDSNPVGRLVTRTTNDVETINELFANVVTSFLKDFSVMIGVFITLFLLDSTLALYSLLLLPPLFIAAVIYRIKARSAFRRVRLAVSKINAFLSEHISGMRLVQLFAREKLTMAEFNERNDEMLKANLGQMYVFATFRPIVDMFATAAIAIVIYFGAQSFLANLVSLGVLIAFINLIRKFFDPVRDLSEKYNIFQSAMAGSERVFALLDEKMSISEPDKPHRFPTTGRRTGKVEFRKVHFRYKEDEPVIRGLNFTAHSGETIAIVGFTGAGKTTITSLLTRLWDIQAGQILLDGIDIRQVPKNVLRRRVQSVLQDVFIFSGTIMENIALGAPMGREEIKKACAFVRADQFIEKLPRGYDTVLTERGSNLSTGQRQLISFARVIAHNPDVLVLDEATSNIDTETEALIQEALKKILADRTSIVIAHRLSTIKNSDRILVLHNGHLVEEGKHNELIRKKGVYYKLYKMQHKEAPETELS